MKSKVKAGVLSGACLGHDVGGEHSFCGDILDRVFGNRDLGQGFSKHCRYIFYKDLFGQTYAA